MIENFQEGCVLLSRSLMDSAVFQNEKWLKVWIWCLMKANHKKMNVPIVTGKGSTVVEIDRGQFIFGRHRAAKELKLTGSTIRNIMEKLKKLENLDMCSDTHFSIVTIRNYSQYQNIKNYKGQAKGQAKDNQRTTKGQPKDTNNNDNNEKNDKKKDIYGEFKNVLLTEDEYSKLQKKFNGTCQDKIENLSRYIEKFPQRAKKYNSHYATILSWENKDGKEGKAARPLNQKDYSKGVAKDGSIL